MVDLEIYNGELTPPSLWNTTSGVGSRSLRRVRAFGSSGQGPCGARPIRTGRDIPEYYPGLQRGDHAIWGGDGREVRDNLRSLQE